MVSRFRRRLLVFSGVLLLILVVAILLVPRLVPGDLIADQITREVARATGAEVTLDRAQIAWRGGWGLTLRDGTMQGSGTALAAATGSPNEVESYEIRFKELSVLPALMPLLRKRVVVKTVQLAGPRIVVKWKKGAAETADYSLRISDLNLDLNQTPEIPVRTRGGGPIPGGDLIPADLSFSFQATADTLVLEEAPYTNLDLKGGLADKVLTVTSLSCRRSTGTVSGNLRIDFVENPWGRLAFETGARQVPASALLETWAPEIGSRLECDLDAELIGGFDLQDEATILRTLKIDGWTGGGPGVLHAGDWLQDITPYLGKRQDLKEVGFEDLVHHFKFDQGRYLIEGLTLTGGDTAWGGQGWVDLEGNIVMGMDVKLPPGFTPDLGNFSFLAQALRDPEGRINLPLKLSGRSDKPTVTVDLGRLRAP
jgi:hypothetical protein